MCWWLGWPQDRLEDMPVCGMSSSPGMWGAGAADTSDCTGVRGRARLPRAWAAQPHTGPPLTCSGVVLHTQSATRLFLHTWLSSVTISPLFRSPGNNPGANSTLPGTTPATPGKEQKAAGHPLLGTGWSNSVSGSPAAPPGRDAIPCEAFPGFLSQGRQRCPHAGCESSSLFPLSLVAFAAREKCWGRFEEVALFLLAAFASAPVPGARGSLQSGCPGQVRDGTLQAVVPVA